MEGILEVVDLDDGEENADWTKIAWDLPPYGSTEFFAVVPFDTLDEFRKSFVYRNAVDQGLIYDDEWVQNYVQTPMQAFVDDLVAQLNSKKKLGKNAVDAAAHEADTAPTEGQRHAGNYRHGHISINGLDIAIENPAGSKRRPQYPTIKAHYGYVKRTTGADGDQIDVFVRTGTPEDYSGPVYIIDQPKSDGSFDEHKVMIGWTSKQKATEAYLSAYSPGWKLGPVTRMTWTEFLAWISEGDATQPVKNG